jgi:very-short-patch-repair endonuclease
MINYNDLSNEAKAEIINKLYWEDNLSFKDIADKLHTYANKILRDANKFGIKKKNKSQAQKNALKTGRIQHPTKGKVRTEEEKTSIGLGVMKSWDNMNKETLKQKKIIFQQLWSQKSKEEKNDMLKKANTAVRKTSKVGSKLEHFILNYLINIGFKTEFHKEQILVNTKLQIDIFLPTLNIAIEIDGPSHFSPVWGEDALVKNMSYDKKKTGLILGKGYKLIRIKQTKDFSKARALVICDKLKNAIELLNQDKTTNIVEIGDSDAQS